jgi:hypothetical protein
MAAGDLKLLKNPTPYTQDVTWTGAAPDPLARPAAITIEGSGPAGVVVMTVLAAGNDNGRLQKMTASIHSRSGDSRLDLTSHPIDPGDPASWAIKTEGRERVDSVAALRPNPPKHDAIAPAIRTAPGLECSRADMSQWTVDGALAAAHGAPLVLILFRYPADVAKAESAKSDAKAALAAARSLRNGLPLPGESAAVRSPLKFESAAAAAIDLAGFSRQRWDEARKGWGGGVAARDPSAPNPSVIGADELMWGAEVGAYMNQFNSGAGALLVVLAPDKALRSTIPLDGLAAAAIGQQLREALSDK